MRVSSVLLTAFAVAVQAQGSGNSNSNDEEGVQPSPQPPRPGSSTPQGCWSSSASDWEVVEVENIATGSCIEACRDDEEAAVAAVGGATCYCGSSYPPEDDTVSDSRCNYACPFYPQEACGGIQGGTTFYSVFNTGLKIDVPYDEEDDDDDDSSSTTASTTTTAASTTGGSSTTQTNEASASNAPQDEDEEDPEEDDGDSGGGGANVGGIVGGVVAGVAVIALLVGGAFWFIRSRRNREIEEEHRRNAAVNSFIAGAKPPGSSGGISMTDSRMDPGLAHRRMSDGSIADNQDYSRKILRVTNA